MPILVLLPALQPAPVFDGEVGPDRERRAEQRRWTSLSYARLRYRSKLISSREGGSAWTEGTLMTATGLPLREAKAGLEEHKEDGTKEHKEMRNTIIFPSERGATAKTQDKRTRRKKVLEYSRTPAQLARLNCSISRQRGEDAVKERPSCANAQN